ncbi:MAG: UDP-2,3-diacylglucosamine diphosphatase [Gammaproteobacteria bacterium]|nr:UDP-2,3-diacylglucosamine diphosphatase [Gammaproteobacteria bacterium]
MTILFIADIHLGEEHPGISERFIRFIDDQARHAEALYILGDLFEAWVGDDVITADQQPAISALRELTKSGVPVYVMHGNRDFLLGADFEAATGCQLLSDPTVIDLYGQRTLLMHGDTLCTDDHEYQAFRSQVRDPAWQLQFLNLSAEQRLATARHYRQESQRLSHAKQMEIMDVTPAAVTAVMQHHGVPRLIHGHTHRPALHEIMLDGSRAQRIVLGDWYQQDSWLECNPASWQLHFNHQKITV